MKLNDDFIERHAEGYSKRDKAFKKKVSFEKYLAQQTDVDKIMKKLFLKEKAAWHV